MAIGELDAYRYGFVSTAGDFVIEPRFLYAGGFRGALAQVLSHSFYSPYRHTLRNPLGVPRPCAPCYGVKDTAVRGPEERDG